MASLRRAAGFIAALLLIALGVFFAFGSPLVGGALVLVGIGAAGYQAWALYQSRRDPYDLSRLWEDPLPGEKPDELDESFVVEDLDEALYCHHCGHAVPRVFARCPDCGNPLR